MNTLRSFFSMTSSIAGSVEICSRSTNHPAPCCIALVALNNLEKSLSDEQADNSLLSLLTPEEYKLFTNFTYEKRRREWLGGRLAAKAAVLMLLHETFTPALFSAVSILPADNGSPLLSCSNVITVELPAISISHSDRFAVAMAAQGKSCGIDIQKISKQTERVADRFSNDTELLLLKNHTPLLEKHEQLSLLWAAKEALKKAMLQDQPIIFKGVVLEALTTDPSITLHLQYPGNRNCPAQINAVQLENFFLAYTAPPFSNA